MKGAQTLTYQPQSKIRPPFSERSHSDGDVFYHQPSILKGETEYRASRNSLRVEKHSQIESFWSPQSVADMD